MRNPAPLSSRFYFPFHSRGPNRNCPSQLLLRYRSPRYILRSCPLPLRIVYRSRIRHCSCLCSLIPTVHRLHTAQHLNKNPLWGYVCWCKLNILPSTLPRPSRNAPPILRLPRRIHPLKHCLLYRLVNLTHRSHHVPLYYLRSIHS